MTLPSLVEYARDNVESARRDFDEWSQLLAAQVDPELAFGRLARAMEDAATVTTWLAVLRRLESGWGRVEIAENLRAGLDRSAPPGTWPFVLMCKRVEVSEELSD